MNNKEITNILHNYKEENIPFGAVSPPIFQTSIFFLNYLMIFLKH